MRRNSLFKRYFTVCSMCVIMSVTVLGVVLFAFASRFLEYEKYDMLLRNARQAAAITADSYYSSGTGSVNPRIITLAYGVLASAIDAEIFLTKISGEIAYSVRERAPVPLNIVEEVLSSGIYEQTGTLSGVFSEPQYIVAVPVVSEGVAVGVVFTATSAQGMSAFMQSLIEMFFISAVVILLIAFILIYFITASLVKPLKEMLAATQSFSQGDFSMRVPVSGFDEIGQLAMAFNNMAGALATTENSRRSFVANVSHELKTPMTTISGFVDGILDGTIPEEKREQYLKIVAAEVKRLSRLVRSMLDTARIEAGEMDIHPSVFDISEVVRQCVFTFEQVITDKRVEIEGLEKDKIMAFADIDLIHQVVYNLVENAVKFVNEDGTLSFKYKNDGKMIYMTVRNSGQGIEKQELPQLFERFYKSDKSRSLNKNGVGLGLHIVRSIINYHKGEILVRSAPGEYTEFECSIPAAPKNPYSH